MRRKPRGLIMGLKRSLSLDQTSSYIAITVQRDLGEASTSSSTKGVMTSLCNYRSRWDLMRSFSQFRNSSESGRYNGILPT
uniref:Uncharacterized protein n=2 Tax=Cajanus cajan TaxID=3821 RepID=A0A151TVA8_CAJCA|nr:hypothetical protein KK1_010217 [Cajanus cajan]